MSRLNVTPRHLLDQIYPYNIVHSLFSNTFIFEIWGGLFLHSGSFLAHLASFHIFFGSREAMDTAALHLIVFAFLGPFSNLWFFGILSSFSQFLYFSAFSWPFVCLLLSLSIRSFSRFEQISRV